MNQLNVDQVALVRRALSEAIESLTVTADCNLPTRPISDTAAERKLRVFWERRIRDWKQVRDLLGGALPGEGTSTDEFNEHVGIEGQYGRLESNIKKLQQQQVKVLQITSAKRRSRT